MAWSEAVAGFFEAFNRGWKYFVGEQSREQRTLEAQADHAAEEKQKALDAYPPDIDAANRWNRELQRVHREIAAKGGR
jgi:hypothetical protein